MPSISVNAKGIVTAVGEHTVTIPDNSNLVPYTGASKDVNLGNHSLSISDKTDTRGTMIKVSGKGVSEDDVWTTIEPDHISMASPGIAYADLLSSRLTISDGAYSGTVTEKGFEAGLRVNDNYSSSKYGYDGITRDGKKLSLPEKEGTIALTSDLSTLLDKGTSSTVVNQVVYNPVEMKKALKVPSIRGENSANNNMSGAPLYSLGGTMATENGQATGSSSLALAGYTGATGNPYNTTLTQTASGVFRIAPGGNLADTLV